MRILKNKEIDKQTEQPYLCDYEIGSGYCGYPAQFKVGKNVSGRNAHYLCEKHYKNAKLYNKVKEEMYDDKHVHFYSERIKIFAGDK